MNIYFSGIGGVGVGPLAMLAQDAGHNIFGSDKEKSPIFEDLGAQGAKVSTDQSGKFMREINERHEIELFIYTSALPDDHPELLLAREYGITTAKRDDLLNQIIEYMNLKLIAVSGTHGKTTTTGMLIWAMKELDLPVSYSVGTRLSFGPAAQYERDSKFFVYEADEFDRNMLKFKPFMSLITTVDFDHSDTYANRADYHQAFQEFIDQSDSALIWNDSSLNGDKLTVLTSSSPEIKLIGEHNRANGTLVLEALKKLLPETTESIFIAAINSFPGTSRRFEKLSTRFYSDYAHHPTEIASTIEMAHEINDDIVIIYQPHQNIRQHQLLKSGGYKNCFDGARKVYWLPTYLSREDKNLAVLTPEQLTKSVDDNVDSIPSEMNEKLEKEIQNDLDEGSLVIAMSAGNLDGWARKLADNI